MCRAGAGFYRRTIQVLCQPRSPPSRPCRESIPPRLGKPASSGNGCLLPTRRLPQVLRWTRPAPAVPGGWNTAALTCVPGRRSFTRDLMQQRHQQRRRIPGDCPCADAAQEATERTAGLLGFGHGHCLGERRNAATPKLDRRSERMQPCLT